MQAADVSVFEITPFHVNFPHCVGMIIKLVALRKLNAI